MWLRELSRDAVKTMRDKRRGRVDAARRRPGRGNGRERLPIPAEEIVAILERVSPSVLARPRQRDVAGPHVPRSRWNIGSGARVVRIAAECELDRVGLSLPCAPSGSE